MPRGFILKKRFGENFFYLFAYGVNDLSHLVVLTLFATVNVLMIVDASCHLLLLFLSGSSREGEKRRLEIRLRFAGSTRTGKRLISRFMEDITKWRRNFLSLSELEYGWSEFGWKRVHFDIWQSKWVGVMVIESEIERMQFTFWLKQSFRGHTVVVS